MAAFTTESCPDDRTRSGSPVGAIVLTSSCRLLFIDRSAIVLLGMLDPAWRSSMDAHPLPSCLMTIVQEIAATHSVIGADGHLPLAKVRRLLGPSSQPVQVHGFLVLSQERNNRRIVLVLSQADYSPMA